MDWLEVWGRILFHLDMTVKGYVGAISSGTVMGLVLAQITVMLVVIFTLYLGWKFFTRRKRHLSKEMKVLLDNIREGFVPKGQEYVRLHGLIAEQVIQSVELLYYRGKITLEEKDYVLEKIAKAIGSKEMLEFARESKRIQIKMRTASYKPLKLPGISVKAKTAFAWATGRIHKR